MSAEYANARALFSAVLALEDQRERDALLTEVAINSPELAEAVRELLVAHERAEDEEFFPARQEGAGPEIEGETLPDDSIESKEGSMIGRYKLLQLIGEGGMGEVWMALQREPVERKVALKIIKAGMDTKQVVARFEAERQALALMDHPHIARVLDGGATERGRPYFVMELVQGIPITGYANQAKLRTRDRLELFLQVCDAVQHAHQKGVIHRDLKPGNIMVANHDGNPFCKVIDFGIAKATSQRLTEKTLFTRHGQMVGTPAYMSPEQAQFSIEDVDTRTDIYSLGCLLYELLTDSPPFESSSLRSLAFDEMCRTIREQDPPKPSARLSTLGDQLVTVASQRGTDAKRLGRIITGELDWIVMKSLEKDRDRRYQTAATFAEDIRRHLGDEPVEAGPPSVSYRAAKFMRRHKGVISAALAVVVALTAGLVVSLWQTQRAIDARQAEVVQRREAQRSAEEARLSAREARASARAARTAENEALDRLYAAHVVTAQRDRENGRVGKVRHLLEQHVPETSEDVDRRGWEWKHLYSLMNMHQASLAIGDDRVTAACWNDEGTRFASGTEEGEILVFDARAVQPLHRFTGHSAAVTVLAWQPGGQTLASSSRDGTALLWTTGERPGVTPLHRGREPVEALAWSPDGTQLATGGTEGVITIRDSRTCEEVRSWSTREPIGCLSWRLSGEQLASGHKNYHAKLQVWRCADGQLSESSALQGVADVDCIRWSPDERFLAAGTNGGMIVLWEPGKFEQRFVFDSGLTIRDLAWHPDGRFLVAAGDLQAIDLIDIAEKRRVTKWFGHRGSVQAVCWHPDGERVLSGGVDGTLKLWDAGRISDALSLTRFENWMSCVRWSPDGSRLAASYFTGTIDLWDGGMTEKMLTMDGHNARVWSLCWSPDGNRVASLDASGTVKVWNAHSGAEIWSGAGPPLEIDRPSVCWHPGGEWLATETKGSAIIWNASTGEQVRTIGDAVNYMAWSADGKFLATVSLQGALLQVWRINGDLFWELPLGHEVWRVGNLAWSPDSTRIAISGQEGRLLIVVVGEEKISLELPIHTGTWFKVAWSPNGTRLATAGQDGVVKVLDSRSGEELLSFQRHGDNVFTLDWSPDGTKLATGGFDSTLQIHDASRPAIEFVDAGARARALPEIHLVRADPDTFGDKRSGVSIPVRPESVPDRCVDLSSYYTKSLAHYPYRPITEPELDGIRFDARGAVQLGRDGMPLGIRHFPRAVKSMTVNRTCGVLHFLHAVVFGTREPEGTEIGRYTIRYQDGSSEKLPIILGKDVWNHHQKTEEFAAIRETHPNVVPVGIIDKGVEFVVSRTSWSNPHPERLVSAIDFEIGETRAAPYLLALTAE